MAAEKKLLSVESIPNPRVDDCPILLITFSDPSSQNAWSIRASRELTGILTEEGLEASGIIFHAPGRIFCSGGQLDDYAAMTAKLDGLSVNREIRAGLDMIRKMASVSVCMVSGDCFGGGIELVSAFDHVIASPNAMFAFWQRKIGLSYGWKGGGRIQARIGLGQTRKLLLDGAQITGHRAYELGLVDRLCRPSMMEQEALRYVLQQSKMTIASRAPLKRWNAKTETEIFENLWWGDEHRESLARRKRN